MEEKEYIRHSDIDLGETFDEVTEEGIRHWKYIRKEKKNGYTRYYYKDDEYDKAEKDFEDAVTDQYRKGFGLAGASQERSEYYEKANSDLRISQRESKKLSELSKAESDAFKDYKHAAKKAEITEKKYRQVKLKSLPRRTIGSGIAAVSTALSMLAGKIKKKLKD